MANVTESPPVASRGFGIHRAWWIAIVAGLVITVTGASTGIPNLFTDPLVAEFGWSRGSIGLAFSVNMVLYGVTAPFAAALMDRVGIRRVVAGALGLIGIGAALTTVVTTAWQLMVTWGLMVGLGTGSVALTFAATITNRWFVARRGLVSGTLTSASMFGGMVVLPGLAWIVDHHSWRAGGFTVAAATLVLVPLVLGVIRNHPADIGTTAFGASKYSATPLPQQGALRRTLQVLTTAVRTRTFWLLVGSFAICGASTNGIMMAHFVPTAMDHHMAIMAASTLLAVMGFFNVVGATVAGWLTDRYRPQLLLAIFYAMRAVTLLLLPQLFASAVHTPLIMFAVCYGLLDLATVPPTIALCQTHFGENDGPVVFGWLNAVHQLGAGAATFLGAVARGALGTYDQVWVLSGALCFAAVILSVSVSRTR